YCSDFPAVNNTITKTLQFADDTALWTGHKNAEKAAREAQKVLDEIQRWAMKWRIKPNPTKSTVVLFRHGTQSRSNKFDQRGARVMLWQNEIPVKDEVRYLGIQFHKYGRLLPDLKNLFIKVRQRTALLAKIRGGIQGCSTATLL